LPDGPRIHGLPEDTRWQFGSAAQGSGFVTCATPFRAEKKLGGHEAGDSEGRTVEVVEENASLQESLTGGTVDEVNRNTDLLIHSAHRTHQHGARASLVRQPADSVNVPAPGQM
jgi:hypothetical protein